VAARLRATPGLQGVGGGGGGERERRQAAARFDGVRDGTAFVGAVQLPEAEPGENGRCYGQQDEREPGAPGGGAMGQGRLRQGGGWRHHPIVRQNDLPVLFVTRSATGCITGALEQRVKLFIGIPVGIGAVVRQAEIIERPHATEEAIENIQTSPVRAFSQYRATRQMTGPMRLAIAAQKGFGVAQRLCKVGNIRMQGFCFGHGLAASGQGRVDTAGKW